VNDQGSNPSELPGQVHCTMASALGQIAAFQLKFLGAYVPRCVAPRTSVSYPMSLPVPFPYVDARARKPKSDRTFAAY